MSRFSMSYIHIIRSLLDVFRTPLVLFKSVDTTSLPKRMPYYDVRVGVRRQLRHAVPITHLEPSLQGEATRDVSLYLFDSVCIENQLSALNQVSKFFFQLSVLSSSLFAWEPIEKTHSEFGSHGCSLCSVNESVHVWVETWLGRTTA